MSTAEIRILLAQHRLRQADVAPKAGICESRLSRLLNDRIKPRQGELERIAKIIQAEMSRTRESCTK
jgi:transcriptional regulator with XRE-family HTH domain